MCWGEGSPPPAQPSRLSLLSHISPAPRSPASQRYFYQDYKSPIQPASPSFSACEPAGEGEATHLTAASVSPEPGELLEPSTPWPGSCLPGWEQGTGHGEHPGGFPGTSTGSLDHPQTPGKKGDGLSGHRPAYPLSLTLLSRLNFPVLSVPLSSSIYFLPFFLSSLFCTLPRQFNPPCSVWLSQAAGVKPPLSGLSPRRSRLGAACAARTASRTWKDPAREEGAADSPRQSTPPSHPTQSRSISALAWRRAPRAIPDLNVLFVRLALGRSSPSARARLALPHPRQRGRALLPSERALTCLQLPPARTSIRAACGAKRAGDTHIVRSHPNTGSSEQPGHTEETKHTQSV